LIKITKRFNESPHKIDVEINGKTTTHKWMFVKGMSVNDFFLFVENENKKI